MDITSTTINQQTETERINLINRFLEKSKEAFLLAIEIMNKPTITYRIETYAFLICNAWELLLKGFLVSKGTLKDILYKDNESKTISLEVCLKRTMKENDPIRTNLQFIISNIRDVATHNIIPQHETIFIPILQAAAINFAKYFEIVFNDKSLSNIKIFYWASIYDDVNYEEVEQQYGVNIRQQLLLDAEKAKEFMNSQEFDETSPFSPFAYIQIKISEVRNPQNADTPFVIKKEGYIGVSLEALVRDALFESHTYQPIDILNITLPKLKTSKASIPVFYYLKQVKKLPLITQEALNYINEKIEIGMFNKNVIKNYMVKNKFTDDINTLKNIITSNDRAISYKLKLIMRALYDKPEIFNSEILRDILQIFFTFNSDVIKYTLFKRLVMYIDMLDFITKKE